MDCALFYSGFHRGQKMQSPSPSPQEILSHLICSTFRNICLLNVPQTIPMPGDSDERKEVTVLYRIKVNLFCDPSRSLSLNNLSSLILFLLLTLYYLNTTYLFFTFFFYLFLLKIKEQRLNSWWRPCDKRAHCIHSYTA